MMTTIWVMLTAVCVINGSNRTCASHVDENSFLSKKACEIYRSTKSEMMAECVQALPIKEEEINEQLSQKN